MGLLYLYVTQLAAKYFGQTYGLLHGGKMHTQCIYVFYVDLRNKQRLFPCTTSTDWLL